MQIPVNKNIDDYKDDFYKGLTLRQTVTLFVTLITGTAAFGFFSQVLRLPQTAAMYLAFPITFPVVASGFLKIHGMDMGTYVRKKRSVKRKRIYHYRPQMLQKQSVNEKKGGTGFEKNNERL